MFIQLNDLLPDYFKKEKKNSSEIWGKNITIERGEYIKIVAPSGSGKTSLVHFIYGLRKEYSGSISYGNHLVKDLNAEEFAVYRKDNISIVLQDMRLFNELTVFDNLNVKRQLQPFHPPEKIKEMAQRLGIGDKLESKCKTCSYGEQQRVAIIRSLMQPFEFLIMDEPFSHLDNNNSEIAMQLILEEAKQRNAAIIFADLERIDYFPFTKLYHL
jgi:putative ABC transport system ATP-binding protein